MSDRRRAPRFVVPETAYGSFRLMQDVYVEQVTSDAVVVLSDVPLSPGEELALELPRALGARSVVQVQVATSSALRSGEVRRHRVTLKILPALPCAGADAETSKEAAPRTTTKTSLPAIGVLIRRVPVHMRDVSVAGCLLESTDALPEGGIGLLELVVDGRSHSETLRLCRSVSVHGQAWPWRSGAHFLGLGAPPQMSVRNVVARFEIVDELGSMPDILARMYRSPGPAPHAATSSRGRSSGTVASVMTLESMAGQAQEIESVVRVGLPAPMLSRR